MTDLTQLALALIKSETTNCKVCELKKCFATPGVEPGPPGSYGIAVRIPGFTIKHPIMSLEATKVLLIPIPGVEPGPPG